MEGWSRSVRSCGGKLLASLSGAEAGQELALQSRARNQVSNCYDDSDPLLRDLAAAQELKRSYPHALHRPTNVTYGYNCNGLTFAARRAQINASSAVRNALLEDGYTQVDKQSALPGDIIIYVGDAGDVEHSGIVWSQPKSEFFYNFQVLSKWGTAHEVLHDVGDCPYDSTKLEFYRLVK